MHRRPSPHALACLALSLAAAIPPLAAVALAGCKPIDFSHQLAPDAAYMPPTTFPCELNFDQNPHRVLRGGKLRLRNFASPAYPDWEVNVMDPSIATARFADGQLEISGLATGSTMLVVHACGRMQTYLFRVAPAASIAVQVPQLFGFPGAPVASTLNAIAGTTDTLQITYLAAEGDVLNGVGAASFSFEGGVSPVAASGPPRYAVDGVELELEPLSFAGAGRIKIRGEFGVVSIDVPIVAQPDALRIYPEIFSHLHVAVTGSVGDDPVAGVTANWEIQPVEHLEATTPLTGVREIEFHRKQDGSPAGPVTITARAGTASTTLTLTL